MQKKRLLIILISIFIILLIPLIAMQFTNEVNWTIFDFAVAGILLLCTALICEYTLRKLKITRNKVIVCVSIIIVFILIWIELAVGIFGTIFAGS